MKEKILERLTCFKDRVDELGGYHAYFSDLDGYYWEVAWGSNFKFDENGLLKF